MDKSLGYVKNWRAIEQWRWYTAANHAHVFQHLIRRANHKNQFWKGIEIKRGELLTSQEVLAVECGVSRKVIRTILTHLSLGGEIVIKRASHRADAGSIISVCNYDIYQVQQEAEGQAEGRPGADQGPTRGRPGASNKNNKNDKNDKKKEPNVHSGQVDKEELPKDFERFWNRYPRKQAKRDALKAWQFLNPDEKLAATILSAVVSQKHSVQWEKDGGQFIPLPASWLRGARWEDEIREAVEEGDDAWLYKALPLETEEEVCKKMGWVYPLTVEVGNAK